MTHKIKPFVVDLHIYPFDVLVCIGQTNAEVVREVRRRVKHLSQDEERALCMDSMARTVMLDCGGVVLRFKDTPPPYSGTLAHEVFHAIHAIFLRIDLPLTSESDEAYAYAIQYLTNEIGKKLGKRK